MFFARFATSSLRVFAHAAEQHQTIAGHIGAVFVIASAHLAATALANVLGLIRKCHIQPPIKHKALAVPVAAVLVGFAVFDDTAIQVIHLIETFMFHVGAQVFTANIASAVGKDWLILGEFFELFFDVLEGANLRLDDVFGVEVADIRFVVVARI